MGSLQALVTGLRQFKAEHGLSRRHELTLTVSDPEGLAEPWWTEQLEALVFARPTFAGTPPTGSGFTRIVAGTLEAFIEIEDTIDIEAEHARLRKRLETASGDLARAEAKLSNQAFLAKAPSEVVEKEKAKATELAALVQRLTTQLAELGD
jgi:valyl-tRNA synthetase